MKLTELIKLDGSLKIVKNAEWPEEILAISALEGLLPQSLVFIKNAKFLTKAMPLISKLAELKIGVVVDEKFYQLMQAEAKASLESNAAWVASSSNVALTLTILSKPFYDLKFKNINNQVDGRQMGTTDIDPSARISQNVFIGEHVKIGANVEILPGCVIQPYVEIGENTKLYPNVTLYPFTTIGKNCRIHSGTIIGPDGFGYTFLQGQHQKIWHMGGVIIRDNVEIGANCCIDQGTFTPTYIGEGTRIDNQVHIAHNCRIGKGCVLCGQVGLAGSVTLEDYVVMGGKAAIGPDAHIGMGTQIAGGAGVNDGAQIAPGSKLGGHPARDLKEWMRSVAYLRKASART